MKPFTIVILLLAVVIPQSALASGNGGAFLAFMGVQAITFLWPLVLPLFFMKGSTSKGKIYLAFVVICYGLLGLLNMPLSFYIQISTYLQPEKIIGDTYLFLMGSQVLALTVSFFSLKKHQAGIKQYIENNSKK